jgi:ribonuclease P protein component
LLAGARRGVGNSPSVTSQDIDRPLHCRISKSEILRGHDAFGNVISASNRLQVRFLRCFYRIEKQIPPYTCMVGFAVKKAGSSVLRNRARRMLRESWRIRKHRFVALCLQKEVQLRCVFIIDLTRAIEDFDFNLVDSLIDKILPQLETFVERS